MGTGIEWTDATWNPVTGCRKVSPGCAHCYAERLAPRVFAGQTVAEQTYAHLTGYDTAERPRRFTDVRCHPERLDQPLRWRKPRRVFVNSMSDLFHEDVPDEFTAQVFAVMAACPQHTFQILTKRPERMRAWMTWDDATPNRALTINRRGTIQNWLDFQSTTPRTVIEAWPLPNVWLGVSVEDQRRADERIPWLLDTPAAVRFLSCEPLLGPVDLTNVSAVVGPPPTEQWNVLDRDEAADGALEGGHGNVIDWVIVGGESGPAARPMSIAWARALVEQCAAAEAACFVKQLGAGAYENVGPHRRVRWLELRDRKGGDPDEWPADLRVREFPQSAAVA